MHKTLERQLARFYGDIKNIPKEDLAFFDLVSKTYTDNDKEYMLMERALDISSKELTEVNSLLRAENKRIEGEVSAKTAELLRSKSHTETIIENLTNGLIEYSSDFTMLRINRTAENILGVKRKDIIGKKITTEHIKDKKLASLAVTLYPNLLEDVTTPKEIVRDTDGKLISVHEIKIHYPLERELQIITAPIVSQKLAPQGGFIKVFRDITREKIISRSKSEFISIAAHQLRTPLSAIKWAMWVLMEGDLGPMLPEQLKLLKRGYDTNEKMIILVNDLLSVARIEDGRFGYEFKNGDIMETIYSLISSMEIFASENTVELKIEKPKENIGMFVFDSKKISLAIQNVIDNAIKYTAAGGTVTIKIERDGEYASIQIKDTGIGIPKDQLKRLFTKFFRARNVLHLQTYGSGLGLFISKNIISRHGGKIEVKSKKGAGSTFFITLPMNEDLIPKDEIISKSI